MKWTWQRWTRLLLRPWRPRDGTCKPRFFCRLEPVLTHHVTQANYEGLSFSNYISPISMWNIEVRRYRCICGADLRHSFNNVWRGTPRLPKLLFHEYNLMYDLILKVDYLWSRRFTIGQSVVFHSVPYFWYVWQWNCFISLWISWLCSILNYTLTDSPQNRYYALCVFMFSILSASGGIELHRFLFPVFSTYVAELRREGK